MSHECTDTRINLPGAVFAWVSRSLARVVKKAALAMIAIAATASVAHAETLLMPARDFLMGASEVVWGVTTLPNTTTSYTINFGDGNISSPTVVVDRSYIAVNHTYASPGTYTITLTAGAETATTTVRVFDSGVISAADLRGLNINRAIENGLRYLWVNQIGRAANFPAGTTTSWGNFPRSFTALTVLAFENHGYQVPNSAAAPTGLYEKYVVQRGLNYVVSTLTLQTLTTQTAGTPCVGPGIEASPCQGLSQSDSTGYSTAIASLALSGSSALSRVIPAGLGDSSGAYVAGKTLGEVLQRVMNTVAWGQIDAGCNGRGGWTYGLVGAGCTTADGSTIGWDVLGLLDANANGIVEPAFVKPEFAFVLGSGGNTDGSFDYNPDGAPGTDSLRNLARAGIYLQGLFYAGVTNVADPRVAAATTFISSRWAGTFLSGDYTGTCGVGQNKACAYGMYNAFKGLKLLGITSLPAAADWYGEYQDWLVANQSDPTTAATGGGWQGGTGKTAMQFSCCNNDALANAAIAELILAPVALVTPDPGLFSTIGLSPVSATNPVGTDHTVTAFAQSTSGAPVPGVTITFRVLLGGQNAGKTGTGTTGVDGKTTFTYHDDNGAGIDTIQAFIGALGSNVVTKTWVISTIACDVNGDGKVTMADLLLIRAKNGQAASGPNDPFDPNHDGKIDVADVRYCQLRLTPP